MTPRSSSSYVKVLRPLLPKDAFSPDKRPLLLLVLHGALAALGITCIARGVGGGWALLPFTLLVGHSFAGVAFVGHETLHGAVVKSRRWAHLIGSICLLPFTVSPTTWKAWHNRVHHGNTMISGVDPDAYPTLAQFKRSRLARFADKFALGHGHPLGFVSLILGFTLQHAQVLVNASREGTLRRKQHLIAIAETLVGVAFWAAVAALIGPRAFLFAYVLPLMIGNLVVMAYIMTNHNLSPLNEVNDPLYNSLSVTVPAFVNVLHLNFGYHAEHHLFPAMSARHAPTVKKLLLQHWPERYQSMSLMRALWLLAKTPRIYKADTVLFDPKSGKEAMTLLPRSAGTSASEPDLPPPPARPSSTGELALS